MVSLEFAACARRRCVLALGAGVSLLAAGLAAASAEGMAVEGKNPEPGHALQCLGTEPFWSLVTGEGAGEAYFSTPEIAEVTWRASEWLPARGPTGRYMIRLESSYGTGYLALLRQSCSDGMSDRSYPYEAILATPAQAIRAGCCRPAAP